jgi:pimeloyl-ACP methyl ester carboxylesterase
MCDQVGFLTSARMPGHDRLNGARLALCIGVLAFLLVVAALRAARPVAAAPDEPSPELAPTADCVDGVQASGARYRICMPDPGQFWNGELVLYAHGYVSYGAPITIPEDQLVVGGVSIPDIITALGYGFATTSYSTNGLAIREGIADLVDLVDVFKTQETTPTRVYLAGASEGGIVTALAVESYPDVFDGGLAACGPVGGMAEQVRYFGDFRVVFDYFFPGLMPGDPVSIPQWLIDGWIPYYTEHISPVINSPSSAYSLTQVLDVTGAP